LFEVVIVRVRADEGAKTNNVCLPGELLVTNPARGEREHNRENDPADGNPGRAKRFLKDPDHHAGGGPSVGHTRKPEMAFVRGAEALGEPIAAHNNRQCAESAHRNGVPEVNAALIGRERREHGETGEKMRMPRKRVIAKRARGLRQNHRESDERERLPKLRRFEPDEKSDEAAARGGKETANGALFGIVTQGGQLGGEIECCAENGESK
jgi:hypothetical protein